MSTKRVQKLSTEDYVIYILNKLEPEKSDKLKLNKIAFLVEFAYILKTKKELSEAEYAAIDYGAVIDGYDLLLKQLQKDKKIIVDGYKIFLVKDLRAKVSEDVASVIDPLIEKYSKLTNGELISIAHDTDSYKITTKNGTIMGHKIDKKLAALESFLVEEDFNFEKISESKLPKIKKENLILYEFNK